MVFGRSQTRLANGTQPSKTFNRGASRLAFVDNVRTSVCRYHHLLVMPSMLEGVPLTLVAAMVCDGPALCSGVTVASGLLSDSVNRLQAASLFAELLG